MKTLKLEKPWTYRTPEVTIDFAAGDHDVKDEIYRKAVGDGAIKEEGDGDRAAKAGATGSADRSKG